MATSSGTDENGKEHEGDNAQDAHDKWFRASVHEALKEADDGSAVWVSNEEAMEQAKRRREALLERAKANDAENASKG